VTPYVSKASVATIPGPPAFVTITNFLSATGFKFSNLVLLKSLAKENNSDIVFERITPVLLKAKSNAMSLPARAPVCDDAADAPRVDVPDLSMIIGFLRHA
jgi:hypothetical protein